MRLHHQPRSRSTRVLWLLEETGRPFELELINREDKQGDEYLKLHPLGRAPVLEDEEGPVFESAALVLHLADQSPEAGLIAPLGSHARALQYQWCFYAMTELEGPLMEIARQLWKETDAPIEEIVEGGRARFARAAAVVEAALGDGHYLVEDTFSVADVIVGSVLAFTRTAGMAELPDRLGAYVDRLDDRPARQRALAVQAPAPAA